jgi:hypothetical protein
MPLAIILIIIGIILALLVSWILGVIVIIIGLAMLLIPMVQGRGSRV